MYSENPPFPRGESHTNVNGEWNHLIGREWVVADVDLGNPNPGAKPHRTNRLVTIRLVRNDAGIALLPKRLVSYSTTAGEYGDVVDGYTTTTAQQAAGAVDEHLPAAGAAADTVFYIVVKGPSLTLLPLAGAGFNGDVAIGDRLVALTAATSGATSAGRVARENITGSTQAADYTFIHNNLANQVGRALSARTTGNTTGGSTLNEVLVEVGRW